MNTKHAEKRQVGYLTKLNTEGEDIICEDEWQETHQDLLDLGYIQKIKMGQIENRELFKTFRCLYLFNPTIIKITKKGISALKKHNLHHKTKRHV